LPFVHDLTGAMERRVPYEPGRYWPTRRASGSPVRVAISGMYPKSRWVWGNRRAASGAVPLRTCHPVFCYPVRLSKPGRVRVGRNPLLSASEPELTFFAKLRPLILRYREPKGLVAKVRLRTPASYVFSVTEWLALLHLLTPSSFRKSVRPLRPLQPHVFVYQILRHGIPCIVLPYLRSAGTWKWNTSGKKSSFEIEKCCSVWCGVFCGQRSYSVGVLAQGESSRGLHLPGQVALTGGRAPVEGSQCQQQPAARHLASASRLDISPRCQRQSTKTKKMPMFWVNFR